MEWFAFRSCAQYAALKVDAHRLLTPKEPRRIPRTRPPQDAKPATQRKPTSDGEASGIGDEGGQPPRCPNRLRRISGDGRRFLHSPELRHPGARGKTVASPGELRDGTVRCLYPRDHAHPRLDANGGAQRGHVIRHVPEHTLPRVLSSSGLSAVRIRRLMAYSRILRAGGCALSPCARNTAKTVILGADVGWSLA